MGHCIKCISPVKPGAVSCPGCGLTFARFDAASVEAPADLKARWLALVRRADADEGAHEAFRRSLDADGLVALGRLYRIQLARNPEDLLARRGRERVLELAVERAAAIPVAPPPSTRTLKNVLAVVVILACIAAVAAFIPFVVRSLRS